MHYTRRYSFVILSALVAVLLAVGLSPASIQAAGPVTFTQVAPTIIPASSDYATEVRGYTWDFSDARSFGREMTGLGFNGRGTLSNGWFVGTTNSNQSKVWLQDASIPNTIPTLNEGGFRPIDTSRYRYLTYRLCASATTYTVVYWHRDRSFAPGSFGSTRLQTVRPGCNLYTFDFVGDRTGGDGSLNWTDGWIQGLALQPTLSPGIEIKLDYARLSATPPSAGRVVTASWTPTSTSFELLFDTDPSGANATPITTISGSSREYAWTTPNLAPGTYYFIARGPGGISVSSPFVVNTPPVAQLLAPSFTSGPDYATTVARNPWDMSDPADIQQRGNITGGAFSNGLFSGTNTNGDAWLELNTPEPIDPSRFYYLTYRMRVAGQQDIGTGSVTRFLWWIDPAAANTISTTKDIVVYEGFPTVSFDLRKAQIEPNSYSTWQNGAKGTFRLDPHEFPTPRGFEVDDVKLTGNDRASSSFAIRYTTSDPNGQPLTTSFYSDTDRSGANGSPITCGTTSTGGGRHKVYLPTAMKGSGGSVDVGGSSCVWNLASVANGDYYIYTVVSDGVNTTTTYSDTPVEVRK